MSLLVVSHASATTYTIRTNADFAKYFGFNRTVFLSPGDVVEVAAGTYSPPVQNAPYNTIVIYGINGAPGNWITVRAVPGTNPVLNLAGNNIQFGLAIVDSSYIRVEGLELVGRDAGTNTSDGIGVTSNEANPHDVQIVGNNIHDFGGNGIGFNISQVLIENNWVHDCGNWNVTGPSGIHPYQPRLTSTLMMFE
jgi:hypothetical protein